MLKPLKLLLTYQLKSSRSSDQTSGFTLIELLVGMIIAFLVLTPLLGFMINIMQTDRREQAKVTSEQEVQTAIDYIAKDLQQAIYIYDAQGLSQDSPNGIRNQIPGGADKTPVLVFWKRQFLPDVIPIGGNVSGGTDDAYVYSLVAYYLIKEDDNNCNNNDGWSCSARISRFDIRNGVVNPNDPAQNNGTPKYVGDYEPTPGFQLFDLDQPGSLEAKMNAWKNDGMPDYEENADVLIDYVDHSKVTLPGVPQPSCSTEPREPGEPPYLDRQVPPYTGAVADKFQTSSFYACVDVDTTTAQVFLRGNALARIQKDNTKNTYSENSSTFFPTASVTVQGRGFLSTK